MCQNYWSIKYFLLKKAANIQGMTFIKTQTVVNVVKFGNAADLSIKFAFY